MHRKTVCGIMVLLFIVGSSTITASQLVLSLPTSLPPSLELLGAGARWAAKSGDSALFVNWKDNWLIHYFTDGSSWGSPSGWPTVSGMNLRHFSISYILNKYGFDVQFAGDIPADLGSYDVVVITAYWAVEPVHEPLIRDYIANGGGVVLLAGVPTFFSVYDKDWWTTTDLSPIQEWFGAWRYVNSGGYATVTVDNPGGSPLLAGDNLGHFSGGSHAGTANLHDDAVVWARWEAGPVFSFSHQYGHGRIYFQANAEMITSMPAHLDIDPDSLNLKSRQQWIAAYIQPPEGYEATDINATTVLLNGTIQPVLDPKYNFVTNSSEYLVDHNDDGILERMVKFGTSDVISLITNHLAENGWKFCNVTLTVTGILSEETQFEGSDTVRVIIGDVNGDNAVNIFDLTEVAIAYGYFEVEPEYSWYSDANEDGLVDMRDLTTVIRNYGKT